MRIVTAEPAWWCAAYATKSATETCQSPGARPFNLAAKVSAAARASTSVAKQPKRNVPDVRRLARPKSVAVATKTPRALWRAALASS